MPVSHVIHAKLEAGAPLPMISKVHDLYFLSFSVQNVHEAVQMITAASGFVSSSKKALNFRPYTSETTCEKKAFYLRNKN